MTLGEHEALAALAQGRSEQTIVRTREGYDVRMSVGEYEALSRAARSEALASALPLPPTGATPPANFAFHPVDHSPDVECMGNAEDAQRITENARLLVEGYIRGELV